MNENQRLILIREAVIHCKKVKEMGMPSSSYAKALREPIHFLWEIKEGPKHKVAKYRSENAVNLRHGNNQIVYDHAIPFKYLKDILLSEENLDLRKLRNYLEKYTVACLITKEEDRNLNKLGLNRKMPDDWDQMDILARYTAAGINVTKNRHDVS